MSLALLAGDGLPQRRVRDPHPLGAEQRGVDRPRDALADVPAVAIAHDGVDAVAVTRRGPGGLPLGLVERGVDRLEARRPGAGTPVVHLRVIDLPRPARVVLAEVTAQEHAL